MTVFETSLLSKSDNKLQGFTPFFGRLPMTRPLEGELEFMPLADIVEHEKEYLIKVELPEVQKDDVKVTVESGTLTISGERKAEKEEKGRKFHRVERYYGRFERSFSIPDDAEAGDVKAEFKDGVLRVHLAKSEKARPKQIEVKVN